MNYVQLGQMRPRERACLRHENLLKAAF